MTETLYKYLDFNVELENREKILLPIYHNCTQDELIQFLQENKIYTDKICDVFGEEIVYTFYGASKYIGTETLKFYTTGERSVCLMLDLLSCNKMRSIYPLDTGFASGNFDGSREYIIPWETIKNKLDLGDVTSRINKMILHCFEGLSEYVEGKINRNADSVLAKYSAPAIISHIKDMHNIIMDFSVGDERRYLIEVLYNKSILLIPETIFGVVVSLELLDDLEFRKLLERYRIEKIIKDRSLFYPTSFSVNMDIEKEIRSKTIEFSKELI